MDCGKNVVKILLDPIKIPEWLKRRRSEDRSVWQEKGYIIHIIGGTRAGHASFSRSATLGKCCQVELTNSKINKVKLPDIIIFWCLGNSAVLLCDYDPEGDQIYSVKWYKGIYSVQCTECCGEHVLCFNTEFSEDFYSVLYSCYTVKNWTSDY